MNPPDGKRILITGFDPFGGQTVNPSWEAVSALPSAIDGMTLIKMQLETVYETAPSRLESAINAHKPHIVICVGQAGGANGFRLERVALNLCDTNAADNAGVIRLNQPIILGAPDGYMTKLPITKMVEALNRHHFPAFISYSAGAFLCNCVYYTALHLSRTTHLGMEAIFVHVPFLPKQAAEKGNCPSMELERITNGLYHLVTFLAQR